MRLQGYLAVLNPILRLLIPLSDKSIFSYGAVHVCSNSDSEQSGVSIGLEEQGTAPVPSTNSHRTAVKRNCNGTAKCSTAVRVGIRAQQGPTRPTRAQAKAPRSHVATEQRRRDRINDGCAFPFTFFESHLLIHDLLMNCCCCRKL